MRRSIVFVALALMAALAVGSAFSADKIKIEKLDDLPRHTYHTDMPAVDLIQNDSAYMALVEKVKADLLSDLDTYEIDDKTTMQGYYSLLGLIAFLEGDYDTWNSYHEKNQAIEDKEAARLTAGLFTKAYIKAKASEPAEFEVNLEAFYHDNVKDLPYEIVGDQMEQGKAMSEMMTENLLIGIAGSRIQTVLDENNGEMSRDVAESIIGTGYTIRHIIPYKDARIRVLSDYLAKHKVEKQDIWAERSVQLASDDDATKVVVGVWDSGTDEDVYRGSLWTNQDETPANDVDDDNNGFVDDVHGIAFTLDSDPTKDLLLPIENVESERPRLQGQMKGLLDMQANIDSKEAQELRQTLGSLKPEQARPFIEDIGKFGNYCHGTHVAGIALAGNPFAELLTVRVTFDYRMIGDEPTFEQARKDSVVSQEIVQYLKDNNVRVVNMSWGGSLSGVESALEEHNVGETPEERKKIAREMFEIGKSSLYEAFKNAPEILFVTSAGNANNDVNFEEFIPSSFDLPNIMSVGAVDLAGDETSFTSFGKVDCYANGFEVTSYVPGGDQMAISGTSQASPQVTNLAAKLFALKPDLTPAQVRKLIEDGCDEKKAGDRMVMLINPKKSVELLEAMN